MTGLAIIAAAMTAAVLNSVHCASIAKGLEFAGGEQAPELERRLSASSGLLNIRHRNWQDENGWASSTHKSAYNHAVTYTYKQTGSLSGWIIAVVVIVPLGVLIGIVVLCVCVCRVCAGQKGGTTHVYQAGPPPYPVSPGTEAGQKS
ncbi:uncharacterized protein LOC142560403 [Dermacentor variabilis]|uniref:uncharacterized protein LOC142560403 n=1 Tax=Dermacentor variabilis TaxID=34621 RepID=UPI003F5BBFCB